MTMKRSRILAMVLILILIISPMGEAFAEQSNSAGQADIKGHWAQKMIEHMISLEVVNDSLVNTNAFQPNKKVTRAETIELILKANLSKDLLKAALKDVSNLNSFSDTKNHKLENYIELSKKLEIAVGNGDGTFKPDNLITREQFATILVNSSNIITELAEGKELKNAFPDVQKERWSYNNVVTAAKSGMIVGYPDGKFGPQDEITRAEAYTMIDNYYNACFVNYKGIVGFISEEGKLLEGADVSLTPINDGKVGQTVKSNKFGQFKFDITEKGEFRIEASKGEALGVIRKVSAPFKNGLLENILVLEKAVQVSGTAYNTSGSVLYEGELSFKSGDLEFKTITNTTGEFNLKLLPNQTYKVYATVSGTSVQIGEVNVGTLTLTNLTLKPAAATPGAGGGGFSNGGGGGGESNSDTTPPSVTITKTGFETESGTLLTTESSIVLKGSAQDNVGLTKVTAVNQPVSADAQTLTVSGLGDFEITVPLNIGGNAVKISVTDSSNNSTDIELYIDRLSTDVTFAPSVKTTDTEDIQSIFDSIVDVWSEGEETATPEDDFVSVLMLETSPLVSAIKNGSISVGDTYVIPQCDYFVTGFIGEIGGVGESEDLDQYPGSEYEVVKFMTPTMDKLFNGDVRMDFSGGIDTEDPLAFILLPDGSQYIPNEENNEYVSVASSRMSLRAEPNTAFPSAGWQPQELLKALIPTVSESVDGNKKSTSLLVKLNDVVIYDKDGNITTENDQIKLGGKFGVENLKYTGGIEWHPNLLPWSFDILPQQILSKITYDEITELKAEYEAKVDTSDLVKGMNSGFNNKREFMGLSLQGVDYNNKIVLVSFGIRLSGTPVVGRIKSVSDQSVTVPFDPILMVSIIMDMDGSVEGTLALTFNKSSSIEKGFNLQKKDFSGAYGSISNNLGQKSYSLPFDRQLEIFDKDESSFNVKLEGSATAKLEVGGGVDAGVMIAGIMPADISGIIFYRTEATLDGSISAGTEGFEVNGNAQFAHGVGARLNGDIRLLAKGFNWSGGIEKKFSWEKMFFEEGISSTKLVGTVSESDDDRDNSNNPKLSDVKVTLKRTDSFDGQVKTTMTDSNGNYEFSNILSGIYEVTFEKDSYTAYTVEGISVSGSKKTVDAVLDTLYENSITGKITIADADTDDTNNLPLTDTLVNVMKITGSGALTKSTKTGADGIYTIPEIPAGLYYLDITKEGYISLRQTILVKAGQTNYYNATLECIPNEFEGEGYASGMVYDVLTGHGVEGLTLDIRAGLNNTDEGEIVKSITTNADGSYSTDTLPAGNYCVQITDNRSLSNEEDRYLPNYFNIKILGGKTITAQNGAVTTSLNANQLRIVLRWGQYPYDLDSHLVGPAESGGKFHTYYGNRTYSVTGTKMADLDLDDIFSYGPETTTIYVPAEGVYSFYVHNYSDRYVTSDAWRLANSGANIKVFVGASMLPLYTFNVPQMEGNLWKVFEYDSVTSIITPVNEVTYESSPGNVGARLFGLKSDIELITDDIRNNPKDAEEEANKDNIDNVKAGDDLENGEPETIEDESDQSPEIIESEPVEDESSQDAEIIESEFVKDESSQDAEIIESEFVEEVPGQGS